jgi:hypothetical protein
MRINIIYVGMNTKVRALILFNERVDRLTRSDLAQRMEKPHYTLDYEKMMKRDWISADGVTEDAVDAFVLNVRLLVQDQDGFSIRRLADDVYAESSVPANLRGRFAGQRERWREHIEQPSMFKHFTEDRNFTNGELFDILMYGGLAHANRDKVDLFCALTKQGAYSSFICGSFLSTLRVFLGVVRAIRDINTELLDQLG